MARKHLFFLLLTLMLICILTVAPSVADETKYIRTNGGHLNVRREPSTDAEVIVRLDYGQEVNVIGYTGDWAEILMRYQGGLLNGYVAKRYLSNTKPSGSGGSSDTDTTTDADTTLKNMNAQYRSMRTVSSFTVRARPTRPGGFVNLRWGPSTEVEVIQRCYAGHELEVLAVGNAWYQVRDLYTGYIGFIMKRYTE